jgi:NADPH2:quinone reductase
VNAATIGSTGPPEVIRFGRVPDPEPEAGQVLVKVGAVAVNPIDTYLRSGAVPADLPFPYVIGCDLAGTVVASGPGVMRFAVGDRVFGSNQGLLGRQGTFSELAAVGEEWLFRTPDGVADEAAAAVALVGITAHLGLVARAGLRPGEVVFVTGGAGGVGSMVVQVAKALGARVATCCGSDEKCDLARSLGADHAFNYRDVPLADGVRSFAPAGVDVFWETRREPEFDVAVDVMAERGRMVLMAGRAARPEFPVGPFYVKGCSLLGFVMFKASAGEQRACGDDLARWLADGRLRPVIGLRLPLSEAAEAHRVQEAATLGGSGALTGKIVLVP